MPNNPGQEERLELAIRAVQRSQISSIRTAAQSYDVPQTTLQDRLNNIKQHVLANRTKRKLTKTEEKTLLQWILITDKRDASLRSSIVQDMPIYCWLIATHQSLCLSLELIGFTISYNDILFLKRVSLESTIIDKLFVKIQAKQRSVSSSYEVQLKNKTSRIRIFTTLIKRASQ